MEACLRSPRCPARSRSAMVICHAAPPERVARRFLHMHRPSSRRWTMPALHRRRPQVGLRKTTLVRLRRALAFGRDPASIDPSLTSESFASRAAQHISKARQSSSSTTSERPRICLWDHTGSDEPKRASVQRSVVAHRQRADASGAALGERSAHRHLPSGPRLQGRHPCAAARSDMAEGQTPSTSVVRAVARATVHARSMAPACGSGLRRWVRWVDGIHPELLPVARPARSDQGPLPLIGLR